MNYVVVEIQTTFDDITSTMSTVYTSENRAEQAYHRILATAALSNLKYHTAVIIASSGGVKKITTFAK